MDTPLLPLPVLPHLKLSFFVNVPILAVLLAIFAVFYFIVTSVIVYHWHAYGMRSHGILVAESLYFLVTIVLFVCSIVSLFYF